MVPIFDAFAQLLQQGVFFFIFMIILLMSNGLVVYFYRKNTILTLQSAARHSLRARKSMEERTRVLERIIDLIPDPVLYKGPDNRYAHCNKALETLWGLPRRQIVNRTPADLFPGEAEAFDKVDRIIKVKDTTVKSGKWLTDSRGKDRFFEIHQMPFSLEESDSPQGILIFFNDVTQLKEEMSSLSSYQETIKRDLQERALFYSQFLRKAVKPLETIQENTEIVMDLIKGDPEAGRSLRSIVEASYLMDAYIRNLAFLAFPDKSALASSLTEKRNLTLEDWQHYLNHKCRDYSRKTGGSTYILLYGDVPENLHIDYRILNDLMDRLIDNAERFSESGFYIMIRIARVEEGYFSMNITIRNTGLSIPQSLREDIFKPFFQLESQEKSRHAGLGLTVARQLAGRMGGSLSCDPSCDDGARFLLSLPPMAGQGNVISGHRLEGHCPGWPSAVLIADDEKAFRERVAGQLHNADLTVFQASDGREAVEQALRFKPDLLLLDSKMPLMNGREAMSTLKKYPETEHMSLYLLTSGFHLEPEPLSLEEEPGDGTLSKPLDWALLLDILIRKH